MLSDKYMLGEELGRGAYGQVFKGMDTRTGDCVAIKQLSLGGMSQDNLAGIMGEIDLLKNLNHPNIVKYVGSFKTRTHLYIILEFMENGALSSVIKPSKFGAFPESLAAVYIAQVLQGLAYLHEQGVVHRDIKGANILTTKDGVVKLADFGVAAQLSEEAGGDEELRLRVAGTPYWMAPEVIELTSVTAAADIWSVGCLAIELLTGQPPYFDLQPMSALFRIVQDEHPSLPEAISADMQDFLLACFQKDPQRRPGAAALLRHRWVRHHRATLRASWSRTAGLKARGGRTDAHVCVSAVVERILQVEAGDAAAGRLGVDDGAARAGGPFPGGIADSATEMGLARSSAHSSASAGSAVAVDIPARGALASPGAEADAGGLATPAQRVEPPRPSAKKPRPPPLDRAVLDTPVSAFVQGPATAPPGACPPSASANGAADAPISPLSGLLTGLGSGALSGGATGQDLMRWLDEKEAAAAAPLGSPRGPPPGEGARAAGALVDGAPTRHQEVAEVRRLVAALRPAPAGDNVGEGAREVAVVGACSALAATFAEAPERRGVFLAEDGAVAILELLDQRSLKVACEALELANAACAGDVRCLEAGAALGLVPAVGRYALPAWPRALREQAVRFVHALCHAGLPLARVLVACQGMPVLAAMVEDDLSDGGAMTRAGLACTWRLLELHGPPALNSLCRLLAAAGLAPRLVAALGAAAAALAPAAAQEAGSKAPADAGDDGDATGVRPPAARVTSTGGASAAPGEACNRDALLAMVERICDLLLVLAHGDAAVKAALGAPGTLRALCFAAVRLPARAQLKCLKCLKHLSGDPSMLEPMQAEGVIGALRPWLARAQPVAAQGEALAALYNLCKISRPRQEAAAAAGVVPYLAALAGPPPSADAPPASGGGSAALRPLAVSLLCGMAHSTERTRAELWANSGLDILLNLLREPEWQGPALDALAAWLGEDPARLEPRLAQRDAVQRFVALFAGAAAAGDSEALARLLDSFLRVLRRSPKVTVEVAEGGLGPLVAEMLRRASALTALNVLQLVRVLYAAHPAPKRFAARLALAEQLRRLAAGGDRTGRSVLVRKQAHSLLEAFRINSVF
ncbi:hypothetical protein WJX81_005420 [Elliptochloris bilobata]|uniref:non-specific serine/threonine protein kinase n=1 Tax=Elliptochloris bilobata TaxID=381761 RepID=A0AAW1QNB4_9CHLO